MTDANDAPQISENDDGERHFELRENCVANEEDCMYTFVATDVDSKPGFGEPFAWRILTPSDAEDCPGIFTMNSSSGVLQLSSGEPQLDFEDYQSCSLQVAVTDAGGAERTSQWTVLVIDVDEPAFISTASCVVLENERPGTRVCTVVASDPMYCGLLLKVCTHRCKTAASFSSRRTRAITPEWA